MRAIGSWARLWMIAAAALLVVGQTARAQTATPTLNLRFGGDTKATRVVLDLTAAPRGQITVTPVGGRLLILAPDVSLEGPQQGAGRGLINRWDMAAVAGGVQISLDVAPGAVVQRRFLIAPSSDGAIWRYVVDLSLGVQPAIAVASVSPKVATVALSAFKKANLADDGLGALAEELRGPASRAIPPSPPARIAAASLTPPPAREAVGRQKVIVIDAGHGGHDTGAQSLVRNEKDINLAAALDLKARLERSGRYRVVLTRSTDVFIPLEDRVRIARGAKADLFISLHSDSAGDDPTPHGASIYTLSDHGVTRVHDVMGPHEVFLRGGDKRTDPAITQILLDITQRNTRNRSAEFAGMLLDHISSSVDLLARSQRDANYYVLLAPDVPAVLLEMGFITNPSDELRLTDPDKRRRMMDRVGDAIDDYFAPPKQLAAQ